MERSLPFYRALLAHLGPTDEGSIVGEHGEVVVYLNLPGGAVGVRDAESAAAVDRSEGADPGDRGDSGDRADDVPAGGSRSRRSNGG